MELKEAEILVVKVGTSTLTYENGKVNLRRMEELCRTLSDLQNAGRKLVLVSSGAIGVGMGKLGSPPTWWTSPGAGRTCRTLSGSCSPWGRSPW